MAMLAGSSSRKSNAGDSVTTKSHYGSRSQAMKLGIERTKIPAKSALGHYPD